MSYLKTTIDRYNTVKKIKYIPNLHIIISSRVWDKLQNDFSLLLAEIQITYVEIYVIFISVTLILPILYV